MNRSFLKWQGGKGAVIDEIKKHLPKGKRLIEPFMGAGNVFINTDYSSYLLNDINNDLINVFRQISEKPHQFISELRVLFRVAREEHDYYVMRDLFNLSEDCKQLNRALLFVYLNRHCFNGVCRYNQRGGFNVPFGKSKGVYFPEVEILQFAKKLISASLYHTDFEEVIAMAENGDVIYCDPPYLPASKTASFTSYHTKPFTTEDHQRLNVALIAAAERGASIVLSNSNTAETREIYPDFTFYEIDARRSSAAKAGSRKSVKELIGVLSRPHAALLDQVGERVI